MRIGIYNEEIYIERNTYNCDVYRPVEKKVLKSLRTVEGLKKYGWDETWREAVHAKRTEQGLDDWLSEALDDIDLDDPENFPLKDDGGFSELTEDERKRADEYLYETYGTEVGTWEWSGCYNPDEEYELILREE